MDAGETIALIFGVFGSVAGALGFLAARRANGIAARAGDEARAAGQEAFRVQARGYMDSVRQIVPEAFTNVEPGTEEAPSPRDVLWKSGEPLKDLAQCLQDPVERTALEHLVGRWRALNSRTANLHRALQRMDHANGPGYTKEQLFQRADAVKEAQAKWEEVEKTVVDADRSAKDALAAGSRNDRPIHRGGMLARLLEG